MPRESSLQDTRPAKRPRMTLPDGFLPTKPKHPPRAPITELPRSEFDIQAASTSAAASSSGSSKLRRPNFNPLAAPPQVPIAKDAPKKQLRVLKPPVFALPPNAGPSARPTMKPLTAGTSLRPMLPPKAPPAAPPKAGLTSILHKQHIIPPAASTSASAMLKPLPPPPALAKPSTGLVSKRPVKSITQTRIARATDIMTEQGTAEIMAIFLQQHGTGFVDPTEREMKRGLEQSPEKRNKKKQARYLRGGLAEAASRYLSAANTSQLLWETDLARTMQRGHTMKHNLHMHVVSIVCRSPERPGKPKSPHAPRVILVQGTVIMSDVLEIRRGPITALFRLSEHEPPMGTRPHPLGEGLDVHVWRPWTSFTRAEDAVDGAGKSVVWCFNRFHVFEPKRRQLQPFPMAI